MKIDENIINEKAIELTEWNRFQRQWSRPAAIRAHMEQGTDFRNFRGELKNEQKDIR